MRYKKNILVMACILFTHFLNAQHENDIWYFGDYAGIDFSTNPPTTLTNSAMQSSEGCSSVSDAGGHLLFYTNGLSIWNKNHVIMANGNGLLGHPSASQSGLVIKQPGNPNIYYVFTVDVAGGTNGLRYTTIDMNLAAGMGSVTAKNVLLYSPCVEKLTAVKSFNNQDVWIVSHEWSSANFRSYKLTAQGVNTICVISNSGLVHGGSNPQNAVGCMKISPNGSKLALAISNSPFNTIQLFDFNRFSGMVSNGITLQNNVAFVYGVEFSPNSNFLYATQINALNLANVVQWDVSTHNLTSILNSAFYFYASTQDYHYGMQLAPNGKIYIATQFSHSLTVINKPDLPGAACAYSLNAQSLGTAKALIGLPAFIAMPYSFKQIEKKLKDPNCSGIVDFQSPVNLHQIMSNQSLSNYSVTGLNWNFGEPTSANNTSTLSNPTHQYLSAGDYTVKLVINYSHNVANDTLVEHVVIINTEPSMIYTSNSPVCENKPLHFSANYDSLITFVQWTGPMGFSSNSFTNSIQAPLHTISGIYKFSGSYGINCFVRDSLLIQVNKNPSLTLQSSTVCLNQEIKLLASGADSYLWHNSKGDSCVLQNYPIPSVQLSDSGIYYLKASFLTGCSANATLHLMVSELPNLSIQILPPGKKCLNDVITFITPNHYITSWQGPLNFYTNRNHISFWANKPEISGNYSLSLKNNLGCESKTVIPLFINNLPELLLSGLTKPECPPLILDYEVVNKNKNLIVSWDINGQTFEGNYLKYNFNSSGNYIVKAKLYDQLSTCKSTYTYEVTVLPKPKAIFHIKPETVIEGLDEINLINDKHYDANAEYAWQISNGLLYTMPSNPSFLMQSPGHYIATLSIKNKEGCVDTVSRPFTVKPQISLYAPLAFTPNNDNKNDFFSPVLKGAQAHKLLVFNRWGNKIFESSDEQFEWDGTYQNQICKEDTYYWRFEYKEESNLIKSENGVVLLMR